MYRTTTDVINFSSAIKYNLESSRGEGKPTTFIDFFFFFFAYHVLSSILMF